MNWINVAETALGVIIGLLAFDWYHSLINLIDRIHIEKAQGQERKR
jgi:hypothetical protein